jgi:hypothetical protein
MKLFEEVPSLELFELADEALETAVRYNPRDTNIMKLAQSSTKSFSIVFRDKLR